MALRQYYDARTARKTANTASDNRPARPTSGYGLPVLGSSCGAGAGSGAGAAAAGCGSGAGAGAACAVSSCGAGVVVTSAVAICVGSVTSVVGTGACAV